MASNHRRPAPGRVRIIAGRWRGRTLAVAPLKGLRPTPDRVRETLFNWLAPVLPGALCLDLFAGSGALGLEAASRGAALVTLVERDALAVQHLRAALVRLGAGPGVQLQRADACAWLQAGPRAGSPPYTVVFVDPPYGSGLHETVLAQLAAGAWLAPAAQVYVECPVQAAAPAVPAGWCASRSNQAGQVRYHLFTAT